MEISIEDLLKNIGKSNEIIEREKLNIELYQKTLLSKINEELKPLKYFIDIVHTEKKFVEYANGYDIHNVTVSAQCLYDCIYYVYVFQSKGKLYRISIPLKYRNMEELTPHMLEDRNYCKVRLYEIDGCWHKIIGYFIDVKQALKSIGGN